MEEKKTNGMKTILLVLIVVAVISAVLAVVSFSQYKSLNSKFEVLCDEYNETYEKNFDLYQELSEAGVKIDKSKLVNEYE